MPELSLDHVIIGVEDLEGAAAELATVLGRAPSWQGRHPSYGTANVLFRLDNAYLELLAPDPQATSDTAWTGSLGRFLKERGPGLFSIALQTADVFATAAASRSRGLPVEEPLPGTGQDVQTGAERAWVNARIPPESTRGTRTFFIEHRSPADALPMSRPSDPGAAQRVAAVVAASSEPEAGRQMWQDVFGLAEAAEGDGWRYDLGNANLYLRPGQVGGPQPDGWQSLELTTADLAAAAARLEAAGIAYEAPAGCIKARACGATLILRETR